MSEIAVRTSRRGGGAGTISARLRRRRTGDALFRGATLAAAILVLLILGGVLAPSLAGKLSDIYGLQAPLWLLMGLALAGGATALFLRETAPRIVARQAALEGAIA